jgi:hypothetical protein
MTNKELIEKYRADIAKMHGGANALALSRRDAISLCDRLEAAEAELSEKKDEFNRMENAWRGEVEKERARLGRENDKLKGLLQYCYNLIPRGKTISAEKWDEIQKILGEG